MKKKKKKKQVIKIQSNIIEKSGNRIKDNEKKMLENQYLYIENMKILRRYYPELAATIEKTPNENRFEWVRTGSKKLPNLKDKHSQLLYYDAESPWEDVKKQIESLNLKNTRLALFLGLGAGYELLFYCKDMVPKQHTSYILVIEKNMEVFRTALHSFDLKSVISNPRIHFLVGEREEALYTKIRNYLADENRFMLTKAMKPVYHSSALRLHQEYYISVLQAFRDAATHHLLFYGNDPRDSLIGIENMLSNINEIVANPGINLLFEKFKNRPAIVVATGPSLNKNKHLLKGLEEKAVIIAADASLKVLMDMDIKPHLVTSLERVMPTVKLLEGFSIDQVQDVYLAACPVVRNELYQAYPGPRIIVYRNFDHFKWLNIDRGILKIQLSSGNMAFKVAEAMGCDPIILIGQDLAYSKDGRSHAAGATYGELQGPQKGIETLEVRANDGGTILTNKVWYSFLKAYEMDLAQYTGTCINSTEGGAYIEGSQVMPFKDAIEQYISESFYPLAIIKENLALFSSHNSKEDTEKVIDLIERTIVEMNAVVAECQKGIEVYEKYKIELGTYLQNPEKPIDSNRLDLIEKEMMTPKTNCRKKHDTFQLFFAHVFQSFVIKFEVDMIQIPEKYDDLNLARVEILGRQIDWYAVIGELALICIRALENARHKIETRIEELERVITC